MKKLTTLIVTAVFLMSLMSCAGMNNTTSGAAMGAGAGGITSVLAGKSGTAAALLIMGGALLGGMIGNFADQQAKEASMRPENRGKTVMVVEEEPNKQGTNCHKVTKRSWKDGNMVSETVEEVCDGSKQTNTY